MFTSTSDGYVPFYLFLWLHAFFIVPLKVTEHKGNYLMGQIANSMG